MGTPPETTTVAATRLGDDAVIVGDRIRGQRPARGDREWIMKMVVRHEPHIHEQVVAVPVDLRHVAVLVTTGLGRRQR